MNVAISEPNCLKEIIEIGMKIIPIEKGYRINPESEVLKDALDRTASKEFDFIVKHGMSYQDFLFDIFNEYLQRSPQFTSILKIEIVPFASRNKISPYCHAYLIRKDGSPFSSIAEPVLFLKMGPHKNAFTDDLCYAVTFGFTYTKEGKKNDLRYVETVIQDPQLAAFEINKMGERKLYLSARFGSDDYGNVVSLHLTSENMHVYWDQGIGILNYVDYTEMHKFYRQQMYNLFDELMPFLTRIIQE